jgi:hypothetical protein
MLDCCTRIAGLQAQFFLGLNNWSLLANWIDLIINETDLKGSYKKATWVESLLLNNQPPRSLGLWIRI